MCKKMFGIIKQMFIVLLTNILTVRLVKQS